MILDILEEHLEEAAWLWEIRSTLLQSYAVDLDRLAEWDERREAHVEGLALDFDATWPFLQPAFEGDDPSAASAAASVLVRYGGNAQRSLLEELLQRAGLPTRSAVVSGLWHAPGPPPQNWIDDWLHSGSPELRAAALEVASIRELPVEDEFLAGVLGSDDQASEVVAAALRYGGRRKIRAIAPHVESRLEHDSSDVRSAAWEAAVLLDVRGGGGAWITRSRERKDDLDLESVRRLGALGDPAAFDLLAGLQEQDGFVAAALWGLGLLGDARGVELILTRMQDPEWSRIAGHAFELVTGAALDPAPDAPPPADDDVDIDDLPGMDPFDGLNRPEPEAARAWWEANRGRFEAGTRWRRGETYSSSMSFATMATGCLANRDCAAFEHAMASDGAMLDVRAPARQQQKWLETKQSEQS